MNRPLNTQEAVLYGRFIVAAYTMFARNRALLEPEPEADDLPDPYELVAWINMSDFAFSDEVPKFYGILARHSVQKHNFVLAIRDYYGPTKSSIPKSLYFACPNRFCASWGSA